VPTEAWIIAIIAVGIVIGLLVWKSDIFRITAKMGDNSLDMSGEKYVSSETKTAQASGAAAVAIADGAEGAEIETNFTGAPSTAADTRSDATAQASGDGAVAISSGAKGAKIKTQSNRG
jgi:hypothetical protein